MYALARTNAVAIAGIDADGDDEPIEPGQCQQRGARLHPIALSDWDRRDDAVERRRQRLRRTAGTLALQRVERRLRVGHCLVGLRELISRRQLLPEELRDVRPLRPRNGERADCLLIGRDRRGSAPKSSNRSPAADRLAWSDSDRQHASILLQAERHAAVQRRRRGTIGGDQVGDGAGLRRLGLHRDARGIAGISSWCSEQAWNQRNGAHGSTSCVLLLRRHRDRRHAGADQRGDRHLLLQQRLLDGHDFLLLCETGRNQINVAALIEIAGLEGRFRLCRGVQRDSEIASHGCELTEQQVDLRRHGAHLSRSRTQACGVFVVQLLARRPLDRNVALVLVEDRQLQAHLRAYVAYIRIVAAAGYAEGQIGKLRQDGGPQLGVLRTITELKCDQVGSSLGQRG